MADAPLQRDHVLHCALDHADPELVVAAGGGNENDVRRLLDEGADVEIQGTEGIRPLHAAAQSGYAAIVGSLLDNGVDVEAKTANGETALHLAAQEGRGRVVELLLDEKVKMEARTNTGKTALHLAAFNGHAAVLKPLLKRGADITALDDDGFTALRLAAQNGKEDILGILLRQGAAKSWANNPSKDPEQYFVEALRRLEMTLAPNHKATLGVKMELGTLYATQGCRARAEDLLTQALQGYQSTMGLQDSEMFDAAKRLGSLYMREGEYEKAKEYFVRALEGFKETLGPTHRLTLEVMQELDTLFTSQKQPIEYENSLLRVLHGYESTLGPQHSVTLSLVKSLGFLSACQGQHKKAKEYLVRALDGFNQALGSQHKLTLGVMDRLDALCTFHGRHEEYESLLRRALDCTSPNPRADLGILRSLGSLFACQGDYIQAQEFLFRALEGHRKLHHSDQGSISEILQELGTLYTSHEQHLKDERLNQELQRCGEQKLKLKYPAMLGTARSFSSYACLEQSEKVQKYFDRALEGCKEECLGEEPNPEYRKMLDLMKELGIFYLSLGRHNEAENLLDQTLRGYERTLGSWHILTLDTHKALGSLYITQKRYQKALGPILALKDGYQRVVGYEHPKTLGIEKDLGAIYAATGRHDEALELLLPVRERISGGQSSESGTKLLLRTVKVLGDVYTSQEKYKEAEKSLLEARQGSGSEIAFEIDTIKSLVRLYIRQQDFDQARNLVAQAERTCEKWGELRREIIKMSGDIHMEQGQYDEASEKYMALRYVYDKLPDKYDLRMLEIRYRVAVVLTKQKQYAEAKKECQDVWRLCMETKAWAKSLQIATLMLLGDIAFKRKELPMSKEMYSKAYKDSARTFGHDHMFTHRILAQDPNNPQEQAPQTSLWLVHLI